MPASRQSHVDDSSRPSDGGRPDVAVCRSRPGKLVFIESGNTDGWIATDSTVELSP